MEVLDPNNVKIYDLSCGKSLPDWLSDRKKRQLLKNNADLRRRIELIQDFDMPVVSTSIRISPDGQYIAATGIYKPRVRCYDVNNLAMKFERCFDSETVTFEFLSDDYSKMVFLQCDRYIEFHSAEGKYYRLRMPKFGRDMKYHNFSCDLYLVGASSELYRLNLEKGQYQTSFVSRCSEITKVTINPTYGLVMAGGKDGTLEVWDPRCSSCVGSLDCSMSCQLNKESVGSQVPSITALKFQSSLVFGVGMSTGQILLYDIRMNKPFRMKDHSYELPIKDIEFQGDNVFSMDSSILKIWNKDTGDLVTSIDAGNKTSFNNLCVAPNSGMLFIANENVKILAYYIPSLGSAPKWCGFLDALTEELQENEQETVYDDYKFVTEKQITELGLTHLIGTDLLRAYMHGYFMDIRLYRKAKGTVESFDYESFKKKKIKEKLDEGKTNRAPVVNDLPAVNKTLALSLREEQVRNSKKSKIATNLLKDDRFKSLFENPDFEVDPSTQEYKLLLPVLKKLERPEDREMPSSNEFNLLIDDSNRLSSSDTSSESENERTAGEESDNTPEKLRKPSKLVKKKERIPRVTQRISSNKVKFYELTRGQEQKLLNTRDIDGVFKENRPLSERVSEEITNAVAGSCYGNKSHTFVADSNESKKKRLSDIRMRKHREERKNLVRSAPYHQKKFNR